MHHFPFRLPHFFQRHIQAPLGELYISSAIMDFAAAAIALFEPIYLWSLGYRIREIMLYYLIVYVAYYWLLPLGGKFIARHGHQRSILISTLWYVTYFVALVGIASAPKLFYFAPLLFALQKTFYWPAYHFDFLRFAAKEERGAEFSAAWAITTVMYVLGPIVGGVTIKFFGFTPMFLGACALILLSSIPHFATKVQPKTEAYSYTKSLALPFRKRYLKSTMGYLGLGEELVGMTIWPIAVAIVFRDLFWVGILVGASSLLTAFVTLVIGKWTDRTAKHNVLATGGIASSAVWLLRVASRATPIVFVTDALGRIFGNTRFISMTAMTYDRAHEDDYSWHSVYYEQGFAIAKSLMALLVIALASVAEPFTASFVAAAVVSFFYLVF